MSIQTIVGEGAFTSAIRDQINDNFAQLTSQPGGRYFVSTTGRDSADGLTAETAFKTVARALVFAEAKDQIVLLPGEYNEDVTVTTSQLSFIGLGPRHSVRITGLAGGTKTAMTLNGVNEVGLYNLNLEGRTSSGSALVLTGQIRRVEVKGCKIHGGDQAIKIASNSGGQIVDVRFEDNVIANSAVGVFVDYSGGDPCHQLLFNGNLFSKIATDCIKEDGATHDWQILNNVFTLSDGVEATRLLDIDTTGTTGLVAGNVFATTVFATGKLALASGVMFIANYTEQEVPGDGTSGRPD